LATKEEISLLAYALWEREGYPEGKADEHWFKAKQFLENQEVLEAARIPSQATVLDHLVAIQRMENTTERDSQYYFRFSFAVAMMAIATSLEFLTPPIIISGLNSIIIGGVLSLLSLVLIFMSGMERDPGRFHPGRVRWAFWGMIIGIVIIPTTALINYYRPNTIPLVMELVGIVIFIMGMFLAIFSRRRQE
jgi:hypothetical protein